MSRPSSSQPSADWQPITTAEALVAAARGHGLDVLATAADLDESGLDFLVAHARDPGGGRWILRTPRRADVFAATAVEARALQLLGSRLPVAVPGWRVHQPDLIAYPRLSGTPAVTVDPDRGPTWNLVDPAAPSPPFLDSMAAVVTALMAIPAEDAVAAGVAVETVAEARAAHRTAMDVSRDLLAPSAALWARWQRWLDDDALWPSALTVVHGDLHPGHMLLADDGRISGVLDWSEAKLSDPTIDLAMFFGCFGHHALQSLVERIEAAGGAPPARAVDRAAERWTAFPAMAAAWALRTNHTGALDHARGLIAQASSSTPD